MDVIYKEEEKLLVGVDVALNTVLHVSYAPGLVFRVEHKWGFKWQMCK